MPLASGARVGPYQILGLLGAGGMGEVYRAHDTALARDVALKTLPGSLTSDADRLARFRREAQVLAALNHPHIGSIYGVEESGAQPFLVLELVEGETLASRIQREPMPVPEALAIAREIAEALEAAHEKGIIHRDLKPANIALTEHDRVKVLDFGLAKATDAAAAGAGDPLNSPTITSPVTLTALGAILGTAAYMSPEQAKGRVADKRSDVWAFGCVLYEMLTGRRAFQGDEVSDTLAAILKSEPAWDALPPSLAPAVRSLLEGCLEKNPRERVADISTARFVLKGAATTRADRPARGSSSRSLAAPILLAVAAAAMGVAAAIALWPRPAPQAGSVTRFEIAPPDGLSLTLSRRAVAVSPDGRRVVYAAEGRLYLRELSKGTSQPIPGGDPGIHPAFSPDGESIVFFADPSLRKIPVTGGVPITICETQAGPFGIDWTDRGIVFVQPGTGIMRVSPNGGKPELLVAFTAGAELVHGPQLLPDGDTLLFSRAAALDAASARVWDTGQVIVHSLKTGERKTLVEGGSDPRYLPTGHLVYMVEGTLMAAPFDLRALKMTAEAVPVVDGIRRAAASAGAAAHVAFSNTGVLVYLPGPARTGLDDVFLYDRKGVVTPLRLPRGSYAYPRVSPDDKWLAFETSDGSQTAISLFDLSGASSVRRLTFGGNDRLPIWTGDGKRVAFQSDRDGDRAVFWQSVTGGVAERLTRPDPGTSHVPESWAPRGDVFLFRVTRGSESSLWSFSVSQRTASRFAGVTSLGTPTNATFSPDGRWVAYQASVAGFGESITYVQPFPPTGDKYEIGRGGRPMWSRGGTELFFVPAPSQFKAVSIRTTPAFAFTAPVDVPRLFGFAPPASPRPYDIMRDGRFVAVDSSNQGGDPRARQLQVVLNWHEELKAKVPPVK